MRQHGVEVAIGRQHDEVVPGAELRQDGVDRSNLDAAPSAGAADVGRRDVVLAIRDEEGQGSEALDDLVPCLRPGEALQEFLEDEPGREDRFA